MLTNEGLRKIRDAVYRAVVQNESELSALRQEVRALAGQVHPIYPRSVTAVAVVAADGGENALQFDPHLVQIVRVVDSYGQELCLDVVTPTADSVELSREQFFPDGRPRTALGRLMNDLGVRELHRLSSMIPPPGGTRNRRPPSDSRQWVKAYRELYEWAALYEQVCYREPASDTLIVFDGLLRSTLFTGDLFLQLCRRMQQAVDQLYRKSRRRVYLVGMAKKSKVLDRYRLALALEGILRVPYPCYVEVPRELERRTYRWPEYALGMPEFGEQRPEGEGEAPRFVGGRLFLVKFGNRSQDPVWPVDLFEPQIREAQAVFGYLLADAQAGFPTPLYPRCLQRAHENAALVGFDFTVLQDTVFEAVRATLPPAQQGILDSFRFEVERNLLHARA